MERTDLKAGVDFVVSEHDYVFAFGREAFDTRAVPFTRGTRVLLLYKLQQSYVGAPIWLCLLPDGSINKTVFIIRQ